MPPSAVVWLCSAVLLGPLSIALSSCKDDPHALLLTLTAERRIETFDLRVWDRQAATLLLSQAQVVVDPPDRDISQPGQGLKVSIEFDAPAEVLLNAVGRTDGQPAQVAVQTISVSGLVQRTVRLIAPVADADGDGFPDCAAYSAADCAALAESLDCEFLDCADDAPAANPMGSERCGNGVDDDCSAGCNGSGGDAPCVDGDKDGVPSDQDCDDEDPCRSPLLREAPNLCKVTAEQFVLPATCTPAGQAPFCDDGVDQDCDGSDLPCVVDADCDDLPADQDCDDSDAAINRQAEEVCGDGRDNNCDGNTDEGCVPCDVDGDGHAAPDNNDPSCDLPEDDFDDYDAGRHPATTADDPEGREGGTLLGALRGLCRQTPNKDGTPEREVDHDGDTQPAGADGCPTVACDGDGDGFPGAQCGPPAAIEDCDDEVATVFPGAPDRCNDGIAQNCLSDTACDGDGDGDGYVGADDCDDSVGAVQPWATEVCDGTDNDCDGLIDEGNPDDQGNLVAPANRCNDSNVGRCGELVGRCGCSRARPSTTPRWEDRTACPGETADAGGAAQRCFGARQPEPERCEAGDYDCDGRDDAPDGTNLADLGQPCSVDQGRCQRGTVTGCDLSHRPPDEATVAAVLGAAYNVHWLCSAETVLPRPETCNGEDDDCDGALMADERSGCCNIDEDGDGFGDCDGDCDDGDDRVFPTQTSFQATARDDGSYDFNCDGVEQPRYTEAVACQRVTGSCIGGGWLGDVPDCGQTGSLAGCEKDGGGCRAVATEERVQSCL